jgi:hypothetical protein
MGSNPVPAEAKVTPVRRSFAVRFVPRYGGTYSFSPI